MYGSMKYVAHYTNAKKLLYVEHRIDVTGTHVITNNTYFPPSLNNSAFLDAVLTEKGFGGIINFPDGDTVALTTCAVYHPTKQEYGIVGYALWAFSILDDAQRFIDSLLCFHTYQNVF